ncbi:MAG: hypothetical protein U9P49_06790 [Thermodesulfobacteriota bacterium]|nr:hypothetical protein [Thermodesulfobacteriota bacterium]
MWYTWSINKLTKISLPLLFACLFFATLCYAGPLSDVLKDWEPVAIQGKIMEVGPEKDYIVIQEKKIILVHTIKARKEYRTRIMDLKGNTLTQDALSKGKPVFVKGGEIVDKDTNDMTILAKDIYLLPKYIREDQMKNYGIFHSPFSPW